MHGGMNTAGVRRIARVTEIGFGIPSRQVRFRVKPPNGMARDGREFSVALGALCQYGRQSFFFPSFFLGGRGALRRRLFVDGDRDGVLLVWITHLRISRTHPLAERDA